MSRVLPFSLALAFDLGFGELPAAGHPVVMSGWASQPDEPGAT